MSAHGSTIKKQWLGLAALALLSPAGLILPETFKAGSAWGEWGPDEMEKMVGYLPQGMKKLGELWPAPLPDYAFRGWDSLGLGMRSLAYIFSAAVGMAVVIGVTILLGKLLIREQQEPDEHRESQ
jgi:hypothetical protein